MRLLFTFISCCLLGASLQAQSNDSSFVLDAYCYGADNSGLLNEVAVTIKKGNQIFAKDIYSNQQGNFKIELPLGEYEILTEKAGFEAQKTRLKLNTAPAQGTHYLKIPMQRLPGYLLEAAILEEEGPELPYAGFAVDSATIEVYNVTMQREELRLVKHPSHRFRFLLEQGNEYIFMIRRRGYYAKRIRANVNVNGCILCFEGMGTVRPGVVDNLTEGNMMGTLSGDINLKRIVIDKVERLSNIYYDLGSAKIRKDAIENLNELSAMMIENPQLVVELRSHTDCRGSDKANLRLSQARAESVVNYVRRKAGIRPNRMSPKGYGESQPVNSCVDGVECSEELHQQNRRTEFIVVDMLRDEAEEKRPLASLMQEQYFGNILNANADSYFKANPEVTAFIEENIDNQGTAEKPVEQPAAPPMPEPAEPKTKDPEQEASKGNPDNVPSETASITEIREPQVVPHEYTGFKIEVRRTDVPPYMDDPIFQAFRVLYMEQPAEGEFSFLVGDFSNKADAEEALPQYKDAYPDARIIEYQQGKRQD